MKFKFWERKKRKPLIAIEGRARGSYLVASTEQPEEAVKQASIRGILQRAHLISESTLNPKAAVKLASVKISGVEYPEDFKDYQNYLDAYYYVPYVARAVDVKQFMIWQMGYDLESNDEGSIRHVEDFLKQIEADTVIRDGTLYALIFGNMYWKVERKGGNIRLIPLNPMKMGIKTNDKGEITEYVYSPKLGKTERFKPKEIIHLKFNAEPWSLFGVSTLRRCLPTIKAILFMEEKIPWIARRRGDPLLEIQIGGPDNPVTEEEFNRIKNGIINRKPGEDIFHDGTITKIQEVYRTAGIGARQALEPLLDHFRGNLVAGLGVPEVALGFGGTTTMATAEYQERLLEAEIRSYQRAIKRMHENQLFKLIRTRSPVKLNWRPLKAEDVYELSKKLQGEIEHGIVSPKYARQRLGYPDEAGDGAVIAQNLLPFNWGKQERYVVDEKKLKDGTVRYVISFPPDRTG